MLPPLPQLFPHLNKRLNLLWRRNAVVHKSAILVCRFIVLAYGLQAQVREVVPEFLEMFLAQNFGFAFVGAAGHQGANVSTSPLFARLEYDTLLFMFTPQTMVSGSRLLPR